MTWQFWKTKEPSAPPPAAEAARPTLADVKWPTDIYSSAQFLFHMYAGGSPPFGDWKAPSASLTPEVLDTAKYACHGYQLVAWFGMVGTKHSPIAKEMALDTFVIQAEKDAGTKELGQNFRALIAMVENAFREHAKAEPKMEARMIDGQPRKLPAEYFMSMGLLPTMDGSPYFGKEAPVEGDTLGLALCLTYSWKTAFRIFQPMHAAFANFDPACFLSWEWRNFPGAREEHLMRRYGNPLFSAARRVVTGTDVFEARTLDTQEWEQAVEEARALEAQWKEHDIPADWRGYIDGMRQRTDALLERVRGMGPLARKLKAALWVFRKGVLDVYRLAFKDNLQTQTAIDDVNAKYAARMQDTSMTEWTRQMHSSTRSFPANEVIPSFLCESTEAISKVIANHEADPQLRPLLAHFRTGALDVVRKALAEGHKLPGMDEKLRVIGVAL